MQCLACTKKLVSLSHVSHTGPMKNPWNRRC